MNTEQMQEQLANADRDIEVLHRWNDRSDDCFSNSQSRDLRIAYQDRAEARQYLIAIGVLDTDSVVEMASSMLTLEYPDAASYTVKNLEGVSYIRRPTTPGEGWSLHYPGENNWLESPVSLEDYEFSQSIVERVHPNQKPSATMIVEQDDELYFFTTVDSRGRIYIKVGPKKQLKGLGKAAEYYRAFNSIDTMLIATEIGGKVDELELERSLSDFKITSTAIRCIIGILTKRYGFKRYRSIYTRKTAS